MPHQQSTGGHHDESIISYVRQYRVVAFATTLYCCYNASTDRSSVCPSSQVSYRSRWGISCKPHEYGEQCVCSWCTWTCDLPEQRKGSSGVRTWVNHDLDPHTTTWGRSTLCSFCDVLPLLAASHALLAVSHGNESGIFLHSCTCSSSTCGTGPRDRYCRGRGPPHTPTCHMNLSAYAPLRRCVHRNCTALYM